MTSKDKRPLTPLSPLQRTKLSHDKRSLSWKVQVPFVPEELLGRIQAVLPTMGSLTCSLVVVKGLLVPRQQEQELSIEHSGRGWEVTAGATTLVGTPSFDNARYTELTIFVDPVFADGETLEMLIHRLADPSIDVETQDFLSVAAGHHAMYDAGELAEEAAFWAKQRELRPTTDDLATALGCDSFSDRSTDSDPDIVNTTLYGMLEGQLDSDVEYLALTVLVDRIAPQACALTRMVDVRSLMGLEGLPGPLSHLLPDELQIRPGATVGELLASQRARHAEQYQWAGGPALNADDTSLSLIFESGTDPVLPRKWKLLARTFALSGAIVLRTETQDDGGIKFTASSYASLPKRSVQMLVEAWASMSEQLVDMSRRPETVGLLAASAQEEPVHESVLQSGDELCHRVYESAVADSSAPALKHGARITTRRELVHCIGGLLECLGDIDEGAVVALLVPADLDFVTGALAALWRGAAFMPLDPVDPPARLADALIAAGARHVVVAADSPVPDLPAWCEVVSVPKSGGFDPGPPRNVDPEATAYVLRTSGSTGRPKAVPIRRSSLDNHLRWAGSTLVNDEDIFPVVSSPVFDASFKQIFGPLWTGRAVHVPEADRVDVAQVHAELALSEKPLVLNCVPSYWGELLRLSEADGPLPLRKLLLGGEAVTSALLQRTLAQYPLTEVHNFYGPTEATVTTTTGILTVDEPVHVGTPVAGARVVVVDRVGHPLPAGFRGEVWIQGPGLSPGYLGEQLEIQSAFVTADFDAVPRPAYRSGDLAKVDEKGRLRLLGRLDDQVKIRGWRIELGEIEQVAESCSGVDRAVAVLAESDEPQIWLFVTGEASGPDVRKRLVNLLPTAMVPESVTSVGRMPLTSGGKVDRRELILMAPTRDEVDPASYSDPERFVATVWRDLLGGPWPHPDDEFFAAGGHSLLLARLVNQLRSKGCTSLSLRQVVRSPTVASIAAHIDDSN